MTSIKTVEIIAHRGASADAPENTLEAFQLGLNQGADAIECDVHLSADGELVVIHDATLKRIAGLEQTVAGMSLAELKEVDAGSWKSSQWSSARIPTLAEVLERIPPDRRFFIEIKIGLSCIVPLKRIIEDAPLPMSQVVLMEFDLKTAVALKQNFPDAEVLWLNDFHPMGFPWQKRRALKKIISTARHHKLDGINLQNIPQLNRSVIHACKKYHLRCYCWTVDDAKRAAKLIKLGIHGIATNRPGWMREQLKTLRSYN